MNQSLGRTAESQIRERLGEAALAALLDVAYGRTGQHTKEMLRGKTTGLPGSPSQYFLHGPGSLLGVLGLRPDAINAMVLPVQGLQGQLPYMRSDFENEIFEILTGQTAGSGSEPTANCQDGTQPGQLKICKQMWPFGRLQKDTQVLDVSQAGRLINRGEFVDINIVGNPWADMEKVQPSPFNPQLAFKDEVTKKMSELWTDFYRAYGHLNFDGNPANTVASSGGYLEWNGLDKLINTGYTDNATNVACPAADSIIQDFGSVTMDANAQLYVTYISQIIRALSYLGERTGLGTIDSGTLELAITMRYSAFLKATEIWPCAYFTTLCTASNLGGASSGSTNFVNAERQMELRNEMRQGKYLLTVFGHKVPVIIDDFITETIPVSGTMQSDQYIVPLKVMGNRPTTYFEFFNWDGPNAAVAMGNLMAVPGTFTTAAGGRFLIIKKPVINSCVQIQVIEKKRLILEAPFLASRLTNVRYTVIEKERSATGLTPSSTYGYQPDGGQYYSSAPYWYPSPK